MRTTRYTLEQLRSMPTIEGAHFDNLKIQDGKLRVWLSRMTVADGAKYDNEVTVEEYVNKQWVITDQYQAR